MPDFKDKDMKEQQAEQKKKQDLKDPNAEWNKGAERLPSTSMSAEDAENKKKEEEEREKEFFYKEDKEKYKDQDGEEQERTILRYGLTEDDSNKAKETIGNLPKFENETQSLLGTPGMTNLTQDGELNSDRSMKAFPEEDGIKEYVEEVEKTAGPNPLPNREGNEKLKAELIGVGALPAVENLGGRKKNKGDKEKKPQS